MSALRRYLLTVEVHCQDPERAEALSSSLDPDNEGYVTASLSDGTLRFQMESSDAGSLRQTADDLLACLKVADEVSSLL